MNVIGSLNQKGGVGKTTISYHVAAGLAHHGLRVLMIDSDPQANLTQGLKFKDKPGVGLYPLLVQDAAWNQHTFDVPADVWADGTPEGSLMICPSSAETGAIPNMIDDASLLVERLEELDGYVDVVVIDTSPTPSMLNAVIYRAMTHALLPTEVELPALSMLHKTLASVARINRERDMAGREHVQIMGIQPNKVDTQTNAHSHGLKVSLAAYKRQIWPSIPLRTIWRDATWRQQSLFRYAPNDASTIEAWAMVARVEQALGVTA